MRETFKARDFYDLLEYLDDELGKVPNVGKTKICLVTGFSLIFEGIQTENYPFGEAIMYGGDFNKEFLIFVYNKFKFLRVEDGITETPNKHFKGYGTWMDSYSKNHWEPYIRDLKNIDLRIVQIDELLRAALSTCENEGPGHEEAYVTIMSLLHYLKIQTSDDAVKMFCFLHDIGVSARKEYPNTLKRAFAELDEILGAIEEDVKNECLEEERIKEAAKEKEMNSTGKRNKRSKKLASIHATAEPDTVETIEKKIKKVPEKSAIRLANIIRINYSAEEIEDYLDGEEEKLVHIVDRILGNDYPKETVGYTLMRDILTLLRGK